MEPQTQSPLPAIGVSVGLMSLVLVLWDRLPLELDPAWAALLALIATALGALIWHPILGVLKRRGWEPESTDPFGGRNEARLAGGAAIGLTYFLPLAGLLALVDAKIHNLEWSDAVLANSAFLVGTTVGGALFYGVRIRACTSVHGWSHVYHESVLVLIWSSLIFGLGFIGYAMARAVASAIYMADALLYALIVTAVPVLLCYVAVLIFIKLCVTPQNHRDDARATVVGVFSMFSVTLAHELFWVFANFA